jgi:hypothetical protein
VRASGGRQAKGYARRLCRGRRRSSAPRRDASRRALPSDPSRRTYAREGDTLAVVRLDHLGRSLAELLATEVMLKRRGITFAQPGGMDRHQLGRRRAGLPRLRSNRAFRAASDRRANKGTGSPPLELVAHAPGATLSIQRRAPGFSSGAAGAHAEGMCTALLRAISSWRILTPCAILHRAVISADTRVAQFSHGVPRRRNDLPDLSARKTPPPRAAATTVLFDYYRISKRLL